MSWARSKRNSGSFNDANQLTGSETSGRGRFPGIGTAVAFISKWVGLIANVASTAISCILAIAGESPLGCILGAVGSVIGIGATVFRTAISALQDAARVVDKALAVLGIKADLVGFFASLREQLGSSQLGAELPYEGK